MTQDAKDNHSADFIVNMKEPASCKEAPAAGDELRSAARRWSWTRTYDTYTKAAAAQVRNGCVGANRA